MEKAENLSEAFDQVCLLIRQSLTAGESATTQENIIAFILACSALALVLYIVAFFRKTLEVNAGNIAPFLIIPVMALGMVFTLFFYETEGFFPCMVVMWFFGAIACGIGKGLGLMSDTDDLGESTEELMKEWKEEDARTDALAGRSVRFSDGTYGSIQGETIESIFEKWTLRFGAVSCAWALFAFIIGPLTWIFCVVRIFDAGCVCFPPSTK